MCAIYVLYCLSSNLLFLAREGTVLVTQIAKTDSTKKQRPNLASTTGKNDRITQNFTDSQEVQRWRMFCKQRFNLPAIIGLLFWSDSRSYHIIGKYVKHRYECKWSTNEPKRRQWGFYYNMIGNSWIN